MTKGRPLNPRAPVEEIAPVSQEPDAGGRAPISKGIGPMQLVAEIVGIISGEQAGRARASKTGAHRVRAHAMRRKEKRSDCRDQSIMAYVKWNPECGTMSVAASLAAANQWHLIGCAGWRMTGWLRIQTQQRELLECGMSGHTPGPWRRLGDIVAQDGSRYCHCLPEA